MTKTAAEGVAHAVALADEEGMRHDGSLPSRATAPAGLRAPTLPTPDELVRIHATNAPHVAG